MGLYLCIFNEDDEIAGVEVGSYADFNVFRDHVVKLLEDGRAGSKFPTLILHADNDGEWSSQEAVELEKELIVIGEAFRLRPAISISSPSQRKIATNFGLQLNSLYDCFFDVDGEPLIERLTDLAHQSQKTRLPILFQ